MPPRAMKRRSSNLPASTVPSASVWAGGPGGVRSKVSWQDRNDCMSAPSGVPSRGLSSGGPDLPGEVRRGARVSPLGRCQTPSTPRRVAEVVRRDPESRGKTPRPPAPGRSSRPGRGRRQGGAAGGRQGEQRKNFSSGGENQTSGVAGDHQLLVRRNDVGGDAAGAGRETWPTLLVGLSVEQETEPSGGLDHPLANRD